MINAAHARTLGASALMLFLAAGCGDSQIKTYKVAHEDNSSAVPAMAASAAAGAGHVAPKVRWDLPKGWKEVRAGEMRAASFEITGENGQSAEVSIIPLPGVASKELESVNMWREQLDLPALTSEQMTQQSQQVQVGDATGRLFDMTSAAVKQGAKFKTHMLGAIANRENITWFIKMLGDEQLVSAQKPAFVEFLKSLHFESAPQMAAVERPISANSGTVPEDARKPKWKVPASWQEKPPGPMITAAYTVTDAGGSADVSISKFPGDVGGKLANVNRWRGQLGLPPVGEGDLENAAKTVPVDGREAYLVDIKGVNARSGKQARMVALGVPRGGDTWFYKLLGDDAAVGKEKDAFLQFVLSAY